MKVWITKYALTQGIEEVDLTQVASFKIEHGYLSFYRKNSQLPEVYFKNDWCDTKEQAINKAEEMRKKKIESLKKQIAKLENIKFEEEQADGLNKQSKTTHTGNIR